MITELEQKFKEDVLKIFEQQDQQQVQFFNQPKNEQIGKEFARQRFITKIVNLGSLDIEDLKDKQSYCYMIIDHYNTLVNCINDHEKASIFGAIVLYFQDYHQAIRVNLRDSLGFQFTFQSDGKINLEQLKNSKGGLIRDLLDDRIYLMRVPSILNIQGYLLFCFVCQDIQVFHVYYDEQIRSKLIHSQNFEKLKNLNEFIGTIKLQEFNDTDDGMLNIEFLGFSQNKEDLKVFKIELFLKNVNEDLKVKCDFFLENEGVKLSIITRGLSSAYQFFFGGNYQNMTKQEQKQIDRQNMNQLLLIQPIQDIHYSQQNQTVFYLDKERLRIVSLKEGETLYEQNIQEEINQSFNDKLEQLQQDDDEAQSIVNIQYLNSDLQYINETQMQLIMYCNMNIKIQGKLGIRFTSLLVQSTLLLSQNGGQIKILFFDVRNPDNTNESIFDGVIDCWISKRFVRVDQNDQDSEQTEEILNHILVAEQQQKNQIFILQIGTDIQNNNEIQDFSLKSIACQGNTYSLKRFIKNKRLSFISQVTDDELSIVTDYGILKINLDESEEKSKLIFEKSFNMIDQSDNQSVTTQNLIAIPDENSFLNPKVNEKNEQNEQMEDIKFKFEDDDKAIHYQNISQNFINKQGLSQQEQLFHVLETFSDFQDRKVHIEEQLRKKEQIKNFNESVSVPTLIPKFFLAPEAGASQASLDYLLSDMNQFSVIVNQQILHKNQTSLGQFLQQISDILVDMIDSKTTGRFVFSVQQQYNNSFNVNNENQNIDEFEPQIIDSIKQKQKRVDIIIAFLIHFKIWQNENIIDNKPELMAIQNMLIDYKLKLIVAQTLREGQQSIINNGDKQEIQIFQDIMNKALDITIKKQSHIKISEIQNVQSFLFGEISKIDILYQKVIEFVVLNSNHNQLKDNIRLIYQHFLKPIFERTNQSLENDQCFQNIKIHQNFAVDENTLQNLFEFGKIFIQVIKYTLKQKQINELSQEEVYNNFIDVKEYIDLFLSNMSNLGIDRDQFQGQKFSQYRDYTLIELYKVVLEYRADQISDEILEMTQRFGAYNLFIRVVYDQERNYHVLYQMIDSNDGFLEYAFKIVYALEKRSLIDRSQKYRGLKMFDIFADKYYKQLYEFLSAVNKDLLILLSSFDLKRQENIDEEHFNIYEQKVNDLQFVPKLVCEKIEKTKNIQTIKSIASIGLCIESLNQSAEQNIEIFLKSKYEQSNILQNKNKQNISQEIESDLSDFQNLLENYRDKPQLGFAKIFNKVYLIFPPSNHVNQRQNLNLCEQILNKLIEMDSKNLKELHYMLPDTYIELNDEHSEHLFYTEKQINTKMKQCLIYQVLKDKTSQILIEQLIDVYESIGQSENYQSFYFGYRDSIKAILSLIQSEMVGNQWTDNGRVPIEYVVPIHLNQNHNQSFNLEQNPLRMVKHYESSLSCRDSNQLQD